MPMTWNYTTWAGPLRLTLLDYPVVVAVAYSRNGRLWKGDFRDKKVVRTFGTVSDVVSAASGATKVLERDKHESMTQSG